jgi:membrane protein YfhO
LIATRSRRSAPAVRASSSKRWLGFTPRQHLAAAAVFGAVTIAFFLPLFRGETYSDVAGRQRQTYPWAGALAGDREFPVLHYDQSDTFYPWQVFMSRALRDGDFPLWNPYSFGGTPFFANGQSGVLYPPRLALTYAVSPTRVHDILLVTHFFLAGMAMFLLLGFVSLSYPAALVGGLAWMLNTFALAWQALEHYVAIGVWLPIAVLLVHSTVRRRSWAAAFGLGVVLALLLLGGNVLFVELAFVAIFGYGLTLAVLDSGRDRRLIAAGVGRLATAAALFFGVTAVSILPTLAVSAESARASLTYSELGQFALDWGDLVYLFRPPPDPFVSDPYHLDLFAGTAVGVLALVGLLGRDLLARFAAVVGALTIFFMLHTPVTAVVRAALPGFENFKPLERAAFMLQFALAVLAAFGLDAILRRLAAPGSSRFARFLRPRSATVAALLVVAIAGSTVAQQWSWKRDVMLHQPDAPRYLYPATSLIRELARLPQGRFLATGPFLRGSTPMIHSLYSAGGYESLLPERVENLWRVVGEGTPPESLAESPLTSAYHPQFALKMLRSQLLARASVAYVLTPPNDAQPSWYRLPDGTIVNRELGYYNPENPYDTGRPNETNAELIARYGPFKRSWEGNPETGIPEGLDVRYEGRDGRVLSVTDAVPPAYVVGGCEEAPSSQSALVRFANGDIDPAGSVILEQSYLRDTGFSCSNGSSGRVGTALVLDRSLDSLTVGVESRRPGWLVVAESWHGGWRASVDDAEASVLPANYAFRAVRVPAGPHVVRFTYEPESFRLGGIISAVSLAVTLGGLALLLLPRFTRASATGKRPSTTVDGRGSG